MNLVDSCGWIEYFKNGPGADFFAPALEDTENLLTPVICQFEVYKFSLRHAGPDMAKIHVANMRKGRIAEIDEHIAIEAAIISHEMKLPMADSLILAIARSYDATLWTQDAHFENIPGVKYRKKGA